VSESVRDLVVSISLNSGNFTSDIRGVNTAVKQAEANFALASAGVKGFGTTTAGMQAKVTQLSSTLSLQQMAVAKCSAAHQANQAKLLAASASESSLAAKVRQTKAAYDASVQATGKESAASQALGNELTKLNGQYTATQKQVTSAASAVQKSELALTNAQTAVKTTEAELQKANKDLKEHGSAWQQAMKKAGEAGDKISAAGEKISAAGSKLTRGVTMPIVALGAAAIAAFNELDDGYDTIAMKTGATGAELDSLNDSATRLYESMAIDMDSAGAVVGEVSTRFGLMGAELESVSTEYLKFAKITGTDASAAVQRGARIMAQYGLNIQDTAGLLGMLARVSQTTGVSTESLMSDLDANSATFLELGMSVEEAINILASFEANGVDAGTALTALKKSAVNYAKEGLTMDQALEKSIAGIKNAKTETEALALAQEIFGAKGAVEMTAAIRSGRFTIEGMTGALSDYGSAVGNTYDTVMDSADDATVAFNKIKSAGAKLGTSLLGSLVPVLEEGAGVVSELGTGFAGLDSGMQQGIIKSVAIAAAAGPVLTVVGKVTSGIGGLTKNVSKFFSTPWMWQTAIVVGAAAAAIALYDVASGAAAARAAIADMNGVAKDFQNNNAATVYDTGNDAMKRFGTSAEDFSMDVTKTKTWLERLNDAWTESKTKTKATASGFADEYKAGSGEIRDAIRQRRETLQDLGVGTSADFEGMAQDEAQLDKWDKEISKILDSSRYGKISQKNQARLNELLTLRVNMQFEYAPDNTSGGYDAIRKGIENEKARAAASGNTVGTDLYSDAITAASQGQAAYNEALDQEYDLRKNNIDLMKEGATKTQAQAALDAWYAKQRADQAEAYKKILAEMSGEVLDDPGLKEQKDLLAQLYAAVSGYNGEAGTLPDLAALTNGLDEGKLASLLATMTAMQAAGAGTDETAAVLAQYQAISDKLAAYPTQLAGLGTIFKEALPDEVKEVLVSLKLDEAEKAWTDFTAGKGSLDTLVNLTASAQQAILPTDFMLGEKDPDGSYKVALKGEAGQVLPTAFFAETDESGNVTIKMKAQAAGQIGTSDMYLGEANEDGTYKIKLKSQSTGKLADTDFVAIENKDGTFTIKMAGQVNGTIPSGSFVAGAVDVNGNYIIGLAANVTLSPMDQTALLLWKAQPENQVSLAGKVEASVGVALGENWKTDLDTAWEEGKLALYGTDGLPIEATPKVMKTLSANDLVVGYGEDGTLHVIVTPEFAGTQKDVDKTIADLATGNDQPGMEWYPYDVSTAQWLKSLQGVIDLYPGVKQIADLLGQKNAGQGITDWTTRNNLFQSIQAAQAAGGLLAGIQSGATVSGDGVQYLKDLGAALKFIQDENIDSALPAEIMKIFDALGIEYNAEDLAASFDAMLAVLAEKTAALKKASDDAATAAAAATQAAATPEQSAEILNMANAVQTVIDALNSGGEVPDGALSTLSTLATLLKDMVPGDLTTKLTDSIKGIFDAMGIEYDPNNLQDALDKLVLDATPLSESTGNQVGAGIGTGMKGYAFGPDAATVATNVYGALKENLQIASPSGLTIPLGYNVGAGIGAGLASYKGTLETDAQGFGKALPDGIAYGIKAGASSALTAIKSMYAQLIAEARVQAALLKAAMEGTSGNGAGTTGGSGDGGGGKAGKGATNNYDYGGLNIENLNGSAGAVDLYALRQEWLAMSRRTAAGYGKA
jgi:phage-related minor tail protein